LILRFVDGTQGVAAQAYAARGSADELDDAFAGQGLQVFFSGIGRAKAQFCGDFSPGRRCAGSRNGALDQLQDLLLTRRELGTFGGKMREIVERAHDRYSYESSAKGRPRAANYLACRPSCFNIQYLYFHPVFKRLQDHFPCTVNKL
jgi:hypothetical protein